jgi:hypothetical protein
MRHKPGTGEPRLELLQAEKEFTRRADNTIVNRLERDGFIDNLYSRR